MDRKKIKSVAVKPAQVVTTKARETKANLHVRWDEALFLAVFELAFMPIAHEAMHLTGHVAAVIIR